MSNFFSDFIFKLDTSYHTYVDAMRSLVIEKPVLFLTHLGDPISLLMISVAILLILWLLRKPVYVIQFAMTMVVAAGTVVVLKKIIGRARPTGIIPEDGYSFPSGHALVSAVFFPLVIYCFRHYIKRLWIERLFVILMLAIMLAIGWSRLYLGVHYLSDVVGGFIVGGIISSLSILFTEGYLSKQLDEEEKKG